MWLLRWFSRRTAAFYTEQHTTSKFPKAFITTHLRTMVSFGTPFSNFTRMSKNSHVTANFWTGATCSCSVECVWHLFQNLGTEEKDTNVIKNTKQLSIQTPCVKSDQDYKCGSCLSIQNHSSGFEKSHRDYATLLPQGNSHDSNVLYNCSIKMIKLRILQADGVKEHQICYWVIWRWPLTPGWSNSNYPDLVWLDDPHTCEKCWSQSLLV